ncbi:MAG TPA: DUF6600 domain-containing protein [Polyangiaceae bacterium]|jgi:hypothetical protein
MDARRWSLPVALLSIALGAPACGGVYARVPVGAAVRVPMAPPGVFVDDDVADGYVAFAAELAPWGRWEGDPTYGVHWCPARTAGAYRPYASGGHWATSDQAEYGSPSGTVTWVDDGGPEWRAVTSHRGWWIDRGANDWCWVPGGSETPARVVWRTGDDFVGWAPEPPSWEDDGDECDDAGFEWSFELLGTLLEDTTDGYTLAGDDARLAATDTSPSQRAAEGGPTFSRRAPAKPVVDAAHGRLADFVGAHEHQLANAGKGGSHASSSSSSSSSSHSGHFTAKNDDDGHADLPVGRMPPAAAMMGVMQTEPAGGGGGFLHGGSPYASGGGGRGGWSGGATGAWGSSNAGSSVASASSGGGSHHNHASAGHTSRGGGSSSHHHGGGGSHHVSSSHHR